MQIVELALNDIVLDEKLNLRDRLDDFTVERYADSWERLPPITVFEIDGNYVVADGFHRHAAAVMLGLRKLRAEVRVGTFTEALDFVASVNLFHGLPLTRSERRRAVEVKLRLHYDWSDRRMAEELAVSRELVAKTRRMLIESKQVPNNPERIGADGKTYTSAGLPRDPNERRPTGKPIAQEDEPRPAREPSPAPAKARADDVVPPWETREAKAAALSEPVAAAAPTIDEMLELMARQLMDMINWTHADGFLEAYRGAAANSRGLFQTAVIKLAARADQLRKA